jgi:hypothetical protein
MGRPPIGKRAMTNLERLHKHRAKLRANKPQPQRPADDILAQELAQARSRMAEALAQRDAYIAELEAMLAKPASDGSAEIAKLKERVARAEMGNIGLRRALAEP